MTTNRKYVRLREHGRRLASQREDLIAAGADPDDLIVPLHPTEPRSRHVGRHAELPDPGADNAPLLESDFARVWMLVVVACVAAFAGCIAAAGAMLMVTEAPTWHVWAAFIAGLGWAGFAVAAGRIVRRLYRQARDGDLR
jgi:hypothetical protein